MLGVWEITFLSVKGFRFRDCLFQLQLLNGENLPECVGSIPHAVMGPTKDHCRYIKALLTLYLGAITFGD